MSSTIAVMGATGQQGGGLVAALLKKKGYKVRGITRNPDSDKAQALAKSSPDVEVVKGDAADEQSLVKAFTGVDGAFILTDCFSAGFDYDKELAQGKTAVDAAVKAKVPFVVFSTLENTQNTLRGKGLPTVDKEGRYVSHFDAKAAVADYLKQSGLKYATVITCPYYDNSLTIWAFQKSGEGITFSDNLGTQKVAWQAVADIGASAAELFADPSKYEGQTIPVVGEHLSLTDAAAKLSQISGKTVTYKPVPDQVFASFGFPGAQDLTNMFAYYRLCPDIYEGNRPMDKRVYKGATFNEWADQNADKLRARLAKD